MKKYLVMPDSFKGTMSAPEVCAIMQSALSDVFGDETEVITVPVADGGEGTSECFLKALGGEKVFVKVSGPSGDPVDAFYAKFGDTAVIEMAAAAGLSLVSESLRDPSVTTTYGVGELIGHAAGAGCRKVILGLGGSCTNDGGAGMAAALGTVFYDVSDEPFVPVGGNLDKICRIDNSETEKLLDGIEIEVMCDIDNPLYGPCGAAYVFAPQKGADPEMVEMLDHNLRVFAETVEKELGSAVSDVPGGGAAGGMGAGAYAFLGGKLKSGIDVMLDAVGFEELICDCEAIFTGEGQLDGQSLGGKAAVGICRRASGSGVPVIIVAGRIRGDRQAFYDEGAAEVHQTDPGSYNDMSEVVEHCREDLYNTMVGIITHKYRERKNEIE